MYPNPNPNLKLANNTLLSQTLPDEMSYDLDKFILDENRVVILR